MKKIVKYPSQEYIDRISEIVETAKRTAHENPEKAKCEAHQALTRMGLLEKNGKAKKQIVTVSYRVS